VGQRFVDTQLAVEERLNTLLVRIHFAGQGRDRIGHDNLGCQQLLLRGRKAAVAIDQRFNGALDPVEPARIAVAVGFFRNILRLAMLPFCF